MNEYFVSGLVYEYFRVQDTKKASLYFSIDSTTEILCKGLEVFAKFSLTAATPTFSPMMFTKNNQ